jgi:hypothetical protein
MCEAQSYRVQEAIENHVLYLIDVAWARRPFYMDFLSIKHVSHPLRQARILHGDTMFSDQIGTEGDQRVDMIYAEDCRFSILSRRRESVF